MKRLIWFLVIICVWATLAACVPPVPQFSDHTLEAQPGEWEWADWSSHGTL